MKVFEQISNDNSKKFAKAIEIGLPKKEDLDKQLNQQELKEALSEIKTEYCTDIKKATGIDIIFPQGAKIGEIDVSGKTLEDVLNLVMDPLETYEPPVVQEQVETEAEQKEKDVPDWLKGHEELIWKGAYENPIWKVEVNQHDDKVVINYSRVQKKLKPTDIYKRTKEDDRKKFKEHKLGAIKNVFTIDEWNVLKDIFNEYEKLEMDLSGSDVDAKKVAHQKMLEVFKQEGLHKRRIKKRETDYIGDKIDENIIKLDEWEENFNKEEIDVEKLKGAARNILSQLVVLNHNRSGGKEKVPTLKPDIKEIPSFEYGLTELTKCISTQIESKKGISLMIGEAGTGKNEALEYFSAKTNRPFFHFPCGRGMEAIDLVQHYEFDTKEGTQRFLTDLAEGVQTPGAIVMIDEVNALKPEVQAILHSLGDANRSLNYDGVHIPAAEGVAIVIAGNPATYGSAGDIGQALLSRTRGQSMVMDYPPLKKGELEKRKEKWSDSVLEQKEQENNELQDYACDEVLVLYPILEEFKNLNDEEFKLFWDVIINETTQGSKISEVEKNPKLEKLLKVADPDKTRKTLIDLRNILIIADEWRKYYEKKTGGLDVIGVSMRDTIAVVSAYNRERDVRKAYLDVMNDFRKNPIEGLDYTLKALEQLIEDTLGKK